MAASSDSIDIDIDLRLQLSADVTTRDIPDGGVLLVNLETGKTWKLNDVGAAVCRGLEQGDDLAGIATAIAGRYGVDAGKVRRDIDKLLAELRQEGLVEPQLGG